MAFMISTLLPCLGGMLKPMKPMDKIAYVLCTPCMVCSATCTTSIRSTTITILLCTTRTDHAILQASLYVKCLG